MHTVKEMIISGLLSFPMGSEGQVYKLHGKRHSQINDVSQSPPPNTLSKAPLERLAGIVFIPNCILIVAFLI